MQENTKLINNCHIWWWPIIRNSENPAGKVLSRLCFGKRGVLLPFYMTHKLFFLHFNCKFWPVLKRFGKFGEFWEPRTEPQPELENRNRTEPNFRFGSVGSGSLHQFWTELRQHYFGFGPGSWFCKAWAAQGRAKAGALGPSQSRHITIGQSEYL